MNTTNITNRRLVPAKKPRWFSSPVLGTLAIGAAGIITGTLAGKLPPLLTGLGCAGALSLLLIWLRPDLALCLFFSGVILLTDSAPIIPGDYFVIKDLDLIQGLPPVLTSIFLLIFFASTIRKIFFERQPFPISLHGLGIYLLILIAALLTGLIKNNTLDEIRVDFMYLLFPVLCFYVCLLLLTDYTRIYRLLTVLLVVSSLKAVILAGFYLAGRGWPYETYRITTQDSADLLAFITLALIALHLLVRRDLRGLRACLVATACIPMLFVTIFAYRRAQWAGLLFSLGLLYLGASKPVRHKLVIALLALLCAGGFLVSLTGIKSEDLTRITSRFSSIFDKKQHSNVHHLLESEVTLQDLSHSPLQGLGLGGKHSPIDGYSIPLNIVHNTFLYIWMKIGLVGLLFFAWAAWVYARLIFRIRRDRPKDPGQNLLLPLAASSGLWLLMFLTGPVPWYFHQTSLLALFAAIGVSIILQADHGPKMITERTGPTTSQLRTERTAA